jgi:hypothetical protein
MNKTGEVRGRPSRAGRPNSAPRDPWLRPILLAAYWVTVLAHVAFGVGLLSQGVLVLR